MSKQLSDIQSGAVKAGFVGKRGTPWWFVAGQGMDANLYDGAIPLADVESHLGFDVIDRPLYVEHDGGLIEVPNKRAWLREDTGRVLGVHSEKYNGHGYRDWLVSNVFTLVGGSADVANVGLLNKGAVAYVQIETPDSVDVGGGVTIRPFLLATTSFDGSIATTYKTGFTNVVCDNTYGMFMREQGETYRVKHTKNSKFDALTAASALNTLHLIAEQTAQEITRLCEIDVTDLAWQKFVEAHAPVADAASTRAVSMAENKRAALSGLYRTDIRVAPWAGTAWGVVQAVNTYNQHLSIVRGTSREERAMLRAVKDEIGTADRATLVTLGGILGKELVTA